MTSNFEKQKLKFIYTLIGLLIGIFALVCQLWLMLERLDEDGVSAITQIIKYFSFMTILTNIFVTATFGILTFSKSSGIKNFISRNSVQSAVAVYIFIVGLIYHLFLAQIWSPTGLQFVVDQLLHTIIPVVYIIYWFMFVRKGELVFRDAFRWVIYPLLYIIYIMIRGAISGNYPYPFLTVAKLGYPSVILNIVLIGIAYYIVGCIFVAVDKFLGKKSTFNS